MTSKCDCGAETEGKWAGIHQQGCASLPRWIDQDGPKRPADDPETEARHVCYDKAHATIERSLTETREVYGVFNPADDDTLNCFMGAMEQNIAKALIDEREACALAADAYAKQVSHHTSEKVTSEIIAARIRRGWKP